MDRQPFPSLILLTPGFPADEQDTACLPFLQDFVLAFRELYPEGKLYVIAFQYPFRKGAYEWKGVEVFAAGGRNRKGLARLASWWRVLRQMRRIRRKSEETGILSLWLTECTLVGQWFSRRHGLPHLAWSLGQDADEANRYLRLLNFNKMRVAANSQNGAERLLKNTGKANPQVVSVGINPEKLQRPPMPRTIDILGVGSLIPIKNYTLFIETIARLREDFPGLQAALVGDGPERDILESLASRHGIEDCLTFTGAVPHAQVIDLMWQSKILLHPSRTEGQAAVFTEALGCGMSVVCFDVGRMEAEGRLFVSRDAEEMYMQTKSLLRTELVHIPLIIKTMKETVHECMALLAR